MEQSAICRAFRYVFEPFLQCFRAQHVFRIAGPLGEEYAAFIVVFAVLIIVLLVKPSGLLGKQIREKV